MYADALRSTFPDLDPGVDDLFLLEPHQIAELPERAPSRELAAVLHAHSTVCRFLLRRHPAIEGFLTELLADHGPVAEGELAACEQALVWELADWIAYQRAPEMYDAGAQVDWDLAAVTELVTLDGQVVIDAGAGTGRVALAAAAVARHVYAVEPVATLRRYMRARATRLGLDNLFAVDGFLHAIPLPDASADVLVTCQAIGWELEDELLEIRRVVKPGGAALHLFGASSARDSDNPLLRALVTHGYQPDTYDDGSVVIQRYCLQIGAGPELNRDPVG
ncbi:MAG: methyltransferase domain-containing protein [Acidimicrobiia bacterium]|nr:methyltransferase domain-containing protein [Acidimicrobiia bacterium]